MKSSSVSCSRVGLGVSGGGLGVENEGREAPLLGVVDSPNEVRGVLPFEAVDSPNEVRGVLLLEVVDPLNEERGAR